MLLGGIDTHPNNPFQGQDPRELKDLTPSERRDATAAASGSNVPQQKQAALPTDADRFYNGDREHWSVDFKGVAAGFLSIAAVELTGREKAGMHEAIGVVENFLRYVLQHDVCPEYGADVQAALQVCQDARDEWPMVERLQGLLPGEFNVSARECFPVAEGVRVSDVEEDEGTIAEIYGLKPRAKKQDPRMHVLASLALAGGNDDLIAGLGSASCRVMQEFDCTLEVVKIHRPADDIVNSFRSLRLSDVAGKTKVRPIGKAIFRAAIIESGFDQPAVKAPVSGKVTLFFDDNILRHMKTGMKMTFTLAQLSNGFRFAKHLVNIVPSFHTFLPQELMKHHKPPAKNERPGPSIHDAGAEEAQHEDENGE